MKIMVVSASDSRFMPLLRGMLDSVAPSLERPGVDLAVFDLGLDATDTAWLSARGQVVAPRTHLGVAAGAHAPALYSFLARPFLRDYFPGYDVYVWIDSDVWLQEQPVFDRYVEGAVSHGMAITHERTPDYKFQAWLLAWTAKHMLLGYGAVTAAHLLVRKHVNAGFFAVRADAAQWGAWADRYAAAIGRTGALVPHDQFALNHAIHGRPLGGGQRTALLDPSNNWICDRGVPMWNDTAGAFCEPRAPFRPIGAMHLAGPAKTTLYTIRRTGGGTFRTFLMRGASPGAPALTGPLSVPAHA